MINNINSAVAQDFDDFDDDIDFEDFDELTIRKDEHNEIVKEFDEAVAKNSVMTVNKEETLKALEEYKNKKNNKVIKQAKTEVQQYIEEEQQQKLLVYKSNYLVNASYKLTLNEQRIILLAISKLDSREQYHSKTIQIKSDEFCKRFSVKKSDFYNTINLTLDSLFSRVVRIRNDEIKHEFRFISSKKYYNNLSYFEITFSNEIMNYLIDLKDNFSKYNLKHVVNFKNKHSVRVYELLNEFSYKNIKKRVITIEELKKCLDLKNEYSRFNSFRESVIDKAVNEIDKYTNISVKYNKIYNSNKSVEAIEFIFSFKCNDVENKAKINTDKKFYNKRKMEEKNSDIKAKKIGMGLVL